MAINMSNCTVRYLSHYLLNPSEKEKERNADVESKFNELSQRYNQRKEACEVLLKNEAILKGNVTKLKQHNTFLQVKYNKLVDYAQEKIDRANTEIARVKHTNEIRENAIKAKNTQLSLKITKLESELQTLSAEMRTMDLILSGLVQQISESEGGANCDAL
eukprot:TRINITY_DN2374_c0_g1_i5.p1 TRINITY_DN2374_c0_g1~~TRINITY_DN2374_c0_g1_i5.p1  ORF type:complete len:161 (-),score=38.85 TRINITY_DN2374_c0_g1_i5:79-561(-)